MTKAERQKRMEEDLIRMKAYEERLYREGNRCGKIEYIAGVDEVGRGPLAGPVVAAAVILPPDFAVLGVNDSKKLSEKRREELYDVILGEAVDWSIGMLDPEVIDRINILEATKEAMAEAVAGLRKRPDHVLIDALTLPSLEIPQTGVVKGDANCLCIAAASIVAKVTRDRMMAEYHKMYPAYGFDRNKGYGTKAHYEGIEKEGICPIHRRTFLKKYCKRAENTADFTDNPQTK